MRLAISGLLCRGWLSSPGSDPVADTETLAAVAYLFFGGFYGEAEHADIFAASAISPGSRGP